MSAPDGEYGVLEATRCFLDRAHLAPPGEIPRALSEGAGVIGWSADVFLADDERYREQRSV